MKLTSQLVLAASIALGFATVDIKSVSAAIINYTFTVDSPIKGKGLFSYDDSTFSNDNIPVATLQSLSFQFDSDSTVYTEKDDVNYPDFPVVFPTTFLTGQPSIGLEYTFNDQANSASNLSYEIVGEDFTIFSTTSPNTEVISGIVSYRKVPEPATLSGTLFALGLGWIAKKKVVCKKEFRA